MRTELAQYRLNKAKENLKESEDALKREQFSLSINRSYYAMFSSARAILALEEKDSSKHSGVISLFNQYMVKTGMVPKEFGEFIRQAKRIREHADYGDFVQISEDDAQTQIERAKQFVIEAEKTMLKIIKESGEKEESSIK